MSISTRFWIRRALPVAVIAVASVVSSAVIMRVYGRQRIAALLMSRKTSDVVDAVTSDVVSWLGRRGRTSPRIVAVSAQYPEWEFKVADGPLDGERMIARGRFNERTFAVRVSVSTESAVEWPLDANQHPRSWDYPARPDRLTADEAAERTRNLSGVLSQADIRQDIDDFNSGYYDGMPLTDALWHTSVARGWITGKPLTSVVLIYRVSRSPRTWNFYGDFAEPGSPPGGHYGGTADEGEIDLATLKITCWGHD